MKRLQNKIAESKNTLPVVTVYGAGVWLLTGLMSDNLWVPFCILIVTALLLVYLNNSIALLRVRSRMVSCTYIVLACSACQLFPSTFGGLAAMCLTTSLLFLFHTYQDKHAVGKVYYAFLFIGLASLSFIKFLWFVPLVWILMASNMQSLSARTIASSLLGIITPYWIITPWFILQNDFSWIQFHWLQLITFEPTFDYLGIPTGIIIVFLFTFILTALSITHLIRFGFEDRTRIRLTLGFLCIFSIACMVGLVIEPQYYDPMLRFVFVLSSPVIAHFLTLTSSRVSNITFFVIIALALAITALNIWMPSFNF